MANKGSDRARPEPTELRVQGLGCGGCSMTPPGTPYRPVSSAFRNDAQGMMVTILVGGKETRRGSPESGMATGDGIALARARCPKVGETALGLSKLRCGPQTSQAWACCFAKGPSRRALSSCEKVPKRREIGEGGIPHPLPSAWVAVRHHSPGSLEHAGLRCGLAPGGGGSPAASLSLRRSSATPDTKEALPDERARCRYFTGSMGDSRERGLAPKACGLKTQNEGVRAAECGTTHR